MKKVAVSLAVAGLVSSLSASNLNVQDQEFLFADSSVNAIALNSVEMVQTQGQVLEVLAPVLSLIPLPLDGLLADPFGLGIALVNDLTNPAVLVGMLQMLPVLGMNMITTALSGDIFGALPIVGPLLGGLLGTLPMGGLPLGGDLLGGLPLGGLLGGDLLGGLPVGGLPLGDLTGLLGGDLLGGLPLGGLLGGDLLAVLPLNDLTGLLGGDLLGALPVAALLP